MDKPKSSPTPQICGETWIDYTCLLPVFLLAPVLRFSESVSDIYFHPKFSFFFIQNQYNFISACIL